MKTVKEIVTDYLKQNGYDGLSGGDGCCCGFSDNNLFICECRKAFDCVPAKLRDCESCSIVKNCGCKCCYESEEEKDWRIKNETK